MPRSARDTRQKILREAHRLFRRSGFFRAGIDEIAAASHVTKRTLYHHFESKDALLAARSDRVATLLARRHAAETELAALRAARRTSDAARSRCCRRSRRRLPTRYRKPSW